MANKLIRHLRRKTFAHLWPLMARYSTSPWMQARWEDLHLLTLAGMNVGRGGLLEQSGELPLLERVIAELHADTRAVVFDVGAHVGDYTAAVLQRLAAAGRAGRVFAFEPAPDIFAQLHARFADAPEVSLQACGLGAATETRTIYAATEHPGLTSLYQRNLQAADIAMHAQANVSVCTLDDFAQAHDVKRIDLLKLDVEGHELAVLQGASRLLEAGSVRSIQFEFGGCNIDSRSYFRDFFYALWPRYELFRVLQRGLHPIRGYREMYELFAPTNFFARLAS